MMKEESIRLHTTGGRAVGYTALHMAANGSDLMFQRQSLVRRLIESRAEVDAQDAKGWTPFLLACGTGVVDSAMALVQNGCNIHFATLDGRNAADRCAGSSGQMRRFFIQYSTVQ